MSDWDFQWTLGSLTLADVCDGVALLDEGSAGFDDSTVRIPGRAGRDIDELGERSPLILPLEVIPSFTNAGGDPGYGHVNLSAIKKELGSRGLVALGRTVENIGTVRAMVKQFAKMTEREGGIYVVNLTCPSGSWQDATEESETGNPPVATTGGDTEIHDPRLTISAAGETEVTLADGTVYTITAAAGPTYPIVVDVGAGTVTDDNGADALGDVTFSHEHWLRLDADSAVSITTDNSVTLHWRNRRA